MEDAGKLLADELVGGEECVKMDQIGVENVEDKQEEAFGLVNTKPDEIGIEQQSGSKKGEEGMLLIRSIKCSVDVDYVQSFLPCKGILLFGPPGTGKTMLAISLLDRNALSGEVPLNLNNLTSLTELNIAHNNLFGALPDLNGMNSLSYVDLSNNCFRQCEPPVWFLTLPSLSTLKLKNNELNDTLNMGSSIGEQLQLVDLQSNEIEAVTLSAEYRNTLEYDAVHYTKWIEQES